MKTLLIAPLVSVSLFFAGCGKEPAQITSESSTPSPSPEAIVPEPQTPATSNSSVSEAAVTPETVPSPSPSRTSKSGLAFKTETATKAASAYLNAYNTFLNDINARPATRGGVDTQTALNNAMANLQKIAQDTAELSNQETQVQQALTPDEVKRLLEYRKNLDERRKQAQTSSATKGSWPTRFALEMQTPRTVTSECTNAEVLRPINQEDNS